jgi:DNA replication protein DnaC
MVGTTLADFFLKTSLTDSQTSAVKKLEQFLSNSNHVFILKGYAGTGKTFMLGGLRQYLDAIDRPYCFVAPTGRAAKVLRKKTKCAAFTIHSLIYQLDTKESRMDIDSDGNYKLYFKKRVNEYPLNTVFIVDESSMVSDTYSESESMKFGSGKLLSDFIGFVDCKGINRKVLFLGDHVQLPPVNSTNCPRRFRRSI